MRVLITGGSGFVGAHTVKYLLARGYEDVVVFDLDPTANVLPEVLSPKDVARVTPIAGDILDLPGILRACRTNGVTHVIHLSACLTTDCDANPYRALPVNVQGMANVLETARLLALTRVVWTSSISVFTGTQAADAPKLDEDSPVNPETLYGASKVLNEAQGEHYFKAFGVDSVGIRLAQTYGVGRTRGRGTWMRELLYKPAVGLPGRVICSDDYVPWLYASDAAAALTAAVEAPSVPRRIYTTAGDVRPKREAAEVVTTLIPDAELELVPGNSTMPHSLDQGALEHDLGWRCAVSMEEGVKMTVDAARDAYSAGALL